MTPTPTPEEPEPISEAVSFKVPRSMKERLVLAAKETDLTMADWIRHVLRSGLDLHEQAEPAPEEDEEEPEEWDLLQARVRREDEARAQIAREQEAMGRQRQAEGRPKNKPIPNRECPHLPSMWRGSRCRCGQPISRSFRVQPSAARR